MRIYVLETLYKSISFLFEKFEECTVQFLLDTGYNTNAISKQVFDRLTNKVQICLEDNNSILSPSCSSRGNPTLSTDIEWQNKRSICNELHQWACHAEDALFSQSPLYSQFQPTYCADRRKILEVYRQAAAEVDQQHTSSTGIWISCCWKADHPEPLLSWISRGMRMPPWSPQFESIN